MHDASWGDPRRDVEDIDRWALVAETLPIVRTCLSIPKAKPFQAGYICDYPTFLYATSCSALKL